MRQVYFHQDPHRIPYFGHGESQFMLLPVRSGKARLGRRSNQFYYAAKLFVYFNK